MIASVEQGNDLESDKRVKESVLPDRVTATINGGLLLTSFNKFSNFRTPVPIHSSTSLIPAFSGNVTCTGATEKNKPIVLTNENPGGSTNGGTMMGFESGATSLTVLVCVVVDSGEGGEDITVCARAFSPSNARIFLCCSTILFTSPNGLPKRLSKAALNKSAFFGTFFLVFLTVSGSLDVTELITWMFAVLRAASASPPTSSSSWILP